MTAESLNTFLWVPFGIVAVIAGLVYCSRGYKKGLWRALGDLGAVVASVAASVWLAKWIAGLATPAVTDAVPVELLLPAEYTNELTVAMIEAILPTVACIVLSMVFFGILMLIVPPVFRCVVGLLLGKGLITKNAFLKFLGFVTGAVTALAFTLCFLAPLYGTLAVMTPVAQLVVETAQLEDQEQAEVCVDTLSGHMLVRVGGEDPMKLVCRELSQVELDGETTSLTELSEAVAIMLSFLQSREELADPDASQPADPDQTGSMLQDLIETVDLSSIEEMLGQLSEEKQTQIADAMDQLGAKTLEEAKKLVEQMDPQQIMDFVNNMNLDWIKDLIPTTAG